MSGKIYAVDPFIKFDGNSVIALSDKTCQKEERNRHYLSIVPLFMSWVQRTNTEIKWKLDICFIVTNSEIN